MGAIYWYLDIRNTKSNGSLDFSYRLSSGKAYVWLNKRWQPSGWITIMFTKGRVIYSSGAIEQNIETNIVASYTRKNDCTVDNDWFFYLNSGKIRVFILRIYTRWILRTLKSDHGCPSEGGAREDMSPGKNMWSFTKSTLRRWKTTRFKPYEWIISTYVWTKIQRFDLIKMLFIVNTWTAKHF